MPFERDIKLMSLGDKLLLLALPAVLTIGVWFTTRDETLALVTFPPLTLTMLGVLWGNGGRLIVKMDLGQLSVTHARLGWKKVWTLPVSMVRPVFEVRRYEGQRSRGLALLVATEPGKEAATLLERARLEVVEQLQRDLTTYYAAR